MYNIRKLTALTLSAALLMCGCGKKEQTAPAVTSVTAEIAAAGSEDSQPESVSQPDHAEIDLSQSKKPAVRSAAVQGVFGAGTLTDIYGAEGDDRRFTEEAGLYGCPVRFECEDMHKAVLTFGYDPDMLRGTPPENFRILHYNEKAEGMEYVECMTDASAHEVSAPINSGGVYLLVDEYARRVALGQDVSGLAVPEPQDELYDGEIPYYAESRPFTVTVPLGCYAFENIVDLEPEGFSYHSFLRIVETHDAFVWADISYITPTDGCSFEELLTRIREQLPGLNNAGEVPERSLNQFVYRDTPDGTRGLRITCTDVYPPSGINPELTFTTVCDYYPDAEGGCYEVRVQFLDNRNDPDKVTNSQSMRILDSFTLKPGAGLRLPEEESTDSEGSGEDTDSEEEPRGGFLSPSV